MATGPRDNLQDLVTPEGFEDIDTGSSKPDTTNWYKDDGKDWNPDVSWPKGVTPSPYDDDADGNTGDGNRD